LETLGSIDSISIFVGNKLFYFTKDDVAQFDRKTLDGHALFRFPGVHYTESLATKEWVNYYGDFNIALKVFCGFLFYPGKFIPAYLFLAGLLLLYRKKLGLFYAKIREKPAPFTAVLLCVIIALGFALRVNGYVRYSGWSDEIYSAVRTGNPHLPLLATFTDSGNPPFYPLVLRLFFKLFGWSEETGTMLSVILGTLGIPALYLLVERNFDRATALIAAFFLAVSGFAIGYSQEMRTYILMLFLLPIIALLFFNFLRNPSLGNLIGYSVSSWCLVNTHYYGILFILANFIFYCLYTVFNGSFSGKKTIFFLGGNVVIALSLLPFFLYQMLGQHYFFDRQDLMIQGDYVVIFVLLVIIALLAVVYRKKIGVTRVFTGKQAAFVLYCLFIPCAIFVLAFLISIKKPMISYKYLLPAGFPFFLSLAAILVSSCAAHKKLRFLPLFLVWTLSVSLYLGKPRIEGGGVEYYRESRAYIAADAAAHPAQKAAMLNNAPQIAGYYGFPDLPPYSPETPPDVLYVFNDLAGMHEQLMYGELAQHGLDDANMLKIIPSDRIVIFKKAFFIPPIHSP